ncbi:hypothetical protein N9937_02170 [bacterium]|nr:hypothetical protein [bacterium]
MSREIITAKTAAETSGPVTVDREELPVSFTALGLAGGEEIVIQLGTCIGGTYTYEAAKVNGTAITLKSTHQNQAIKGPCILRFVKPITAGLAGVSMHTRGNV